MFSFFPSIYPVYTIYNVKYFHLKLKETPKSRFLKEENTTDLTSNYHARMASPRTEMSLFSALFHFLSILPGEWMQKLYQMTYYKVNGSYFCISFIIILYPLKVITFFFLF